MKRFYYVGLDFTSDEKQMFLERLKNEDVDIPMKWHSFSEDGFFIDTECNPILVEWKDVEHFLTVHTIREIRHNYPDNIKDAFFAIVGKL